MLKSGTRLSPIFCALVAICLAGIGSANYQCSGTTQIDPVFITDESNISIEQCTYVDIVRISTTNASMIMDHLMVSASTFMKGFELDFKGTVPNDVMKWEGNQVRGGSVHLHNMKAMGGVRFSGGVLQTELRITDTLFAQGAAVSIEHMSGNGSVLFQSVQALQRASISLVSSTISELRVTSTTLHNVSIALVNVQTTGESEEAILIHQSRLVSTNLSIVHSTLNSNGTAIGFRSVSGINEWNGGHILVSNSNISGGSSEQSYAFDNRYSPADSRYSDLVQTTLRLRNCIVGGKVRWEASWVDINNTTFDNEVSFQNEHTMHSIIVRDVRAASHVRFIDNSFSEDALIAFRNISGVGIEFDGGRQIIGANFTMYNVTLHAPTSEGGFILTKVQFVNVSLTVSACRLSAWNGFWFRSQRWDWIGGTFIVYQSVITALNESYRGIDSYWRWSPTAARFGRAIGVTMSVVDTNVTGGIQWSSADLSMSNVHILRVGSGIRFTDAPSVAAQVSFVDITVSGPLLYSQNVHRPCVNITFERVKAASITLQGIPLANATIVFRDIVLDNTTTNEASGVGFYECTSIQHVLLVMRRVRIRNDNIGIWFRGTTGHHHWDDSRIALSEVTVEPRDHLLTEHAVWRHYSGWPLHSQWTLFRRVTVSVVDCEFQGSVNWGGDNLLVERSLFADNVFLEGGVVDDNLRFDHVTVLRGRLQLSGYAFGVAQSTVVQSQRTAVSFIDSRFPSLYFGVDPPSFSNVDLQFRHVTVAPGTSQGLPAVSGIWFHDGTFDNVTLTVIDALFNVTTHGIYFVNVNTFWRRGSIHLCGVRMPTPSNGTEGETFLVQTFHTWYGGLGRRHLPLINVTVSLSQISAPNSTISSRGGAVEFSAVNVSLGALTVDTAQGQNFTLINSTVTLLTMEKIDVDRIRILNVEGRWASLKFLTPQSSSLTRPPFSFQCLGLRLAGGSSPPEGADVASALYFNDLPLVQGAVAYFQDVSIVTVQSYALRFNGYTYGNVQNSTLRFLGTNAFEGSVKGMYWEPSWTRLTNSTVTASNGTQFTPASQFAQMTGAKASCCASPRSVCGSTPCLADPVDPVPLWEPQQRQALSGCIFTGLPVWSSTRTSTISMTDGAVHTGTRTLSLTKDTTLTTVVAAATRTAWYAAVVTSTEERVASSAPKLVPTISPEETPERESYHRSKTIGAPSPSAIIKTKVSMLTESVSFEDPSDADGIAPFADHYELSSVVPSEAARRVLLSTATGATVVTSLISGTAVTQSGRLQSVLRLLECALADDDTAPSLLEHPLQPAVGSGQLAHYAGAVLMSTLLCTAFVILGLLMGYKNPQRLPSIQGTIPRTLAATGTVFYAFFVPAIAGSSVTIAIHGAGAAETGIGAMGLGVVSLMLGGLLYSLTAGFAAAHRLRGDDGAGKVRGEFVDADLAAGKYSFTATVGPYFYDGKDANPLHRIYFWEDVAAAAVVDVLSGIRPNGNDCTGVAIPLVIVSALHLLYVGVFRPYHAKLDNLFAIVFAVNNTVLGILVTVAIQNPALLTAVGWTAIIQLISFYLQSVVQALHACYRHNRRTYFVKMQRADTVASSVHGESASNGGSASEMDIPLLEIPITEVNPGRNRNDRIGANPLL